MLMINYLLPKLFLQTTKLKEAFNNAKLKINQVIQKITKPLKRNSLELNHYNKKLTYLKMLNRTQPLMNLKKWLIN